MGYGFPPSNARDMDAWYQSENGAMALRLQMVLMMRLLGPFRGLRLLDVGCGAGHHMELFRREGFFVVGLDSSKTALSLARERLGFKVRLFHGQAEKLPFHDDEYDIVTLIHTLEFLDHPEAALAEAFRVAKRHVFVGVINSTSLTSIGYRVKGFFAASHRNNFRRFSLWDVSRMMKATEIPCHIHWATTGVLPGSLTGRAVFLETDPLVQRNPFGAFLGVSASLAETIQSYDPVKKLGLNHVRARPAASPTAKAHFNCVPENGKDVDNWVGGT